MDTFQSRLKFAREVRGLSQLELANRIGVDPIVISRYERGKIEPHMKRAEGLSEALSVTLDWLIRGIGDGPVAAAGDAA